MTWQPGNAARTSRSNPASGTRGGALTDRKTRSRYVRLDDVKQNYADIGDANWYEKTLYSLDNGETVPAAVLWTPPDFWRAINGTIANRILDQIERGPADGHRYSAANRAQDRAAWRVLQEHCPTLTDAQAKTVLFTWLKNATLEAREYDDPVVRKKCMGLFVIKRPG